MRPQAGQHQFGAQSEEIPNSVMPALPAKLTADCTDAEGSVMASLTGFAKSNETYWPCSIIRTAYFQRPGL